MESFESFVQQCFNFCAFMCTTISDIGIDFISIIHIIESINDGKGREAMKKFYLPSDSDILVEVLSAYVFPETLLGAVRYGQGHINDTYCIVCQPEEGEPVRFILQGLSTVAFPNPEQLMENFKGITSYLREKVLASGGDEERETLRLIPTRDGKDYYRDTAGKVWRLMPYVENTVCYQEATAELFEESARAFGRFQMLLKDYPAQSLYETIPHFHDTEDRFRKLEDAIRQDKYDRVKLVRDEIAFAYTRKSDCSVVLQAYRDGKLPLRVTHNDTKLNNILIDKSTGKGICVIDLDTTMPGFSVNDFGDSIRFGANHAADDEVDLSKVNFDITLYEAYTRGFLEGTEGSLTTGELEYLPWGAKLMTLECGIRFLTDYLDGDRYFHIRYPDHNLRRCRTQFKLVSDMESQFEQMHTIVQKLALNRMR